MPGPGTGLTSLALLLTGLAVLAAPASGQEGVRADPAAPGATAVLLAGLGPVFDGGNLVSWTGNLMLEVEVGRSPLRGTIFASVRGLGAACADGCDLSGEGVGMRVEGVLGTLAIGAGWGLLHQSGRWHGQPFGSLSMARGALRVQARIEVPRGGFGVNVPLLVGIGIPLGGRR